MEMISRVYEINPEKALQMMRRDLEVVFGKRPKKTEAEIEKEIADFFEDSNQ
jgi:hypothetical protein